MEFLAPLILGIAGSFHCIGMCGPIAIALPGSPDVSIYAYIRGRLLYNIGRILTYVLVGVIVGIGGSVIVLAGMGKYLSIGAGIAMIAMAVVQLALRRDVIPMGLLYKISKPFNRSIRALFASGSSASLFAIGLLNGLLPCGLVATALVGSLTAGSVWGAGMFMLFFGVGTLPAMLLTAFGNSFLSISVRSRMRMLAPYLVLLVGVLILMRGMNLGIPFVSPHHGDSSVTCCPE